MDEGASTITSHMRLQPARFSLHIPFILPWVLSFFLAVMVDTVGLSLGSKMMPLPGLVHDHRLGRDAGAKAWPSCVSLGQH